MTLSTRSNSAAQQAVERLTSKPRLTMTFIRRSYFLPCESYDRGLENDSPGSTQRSLQLLAKPQGFLKASTSRCPNEAEITVLIRRPPIRSGERACRWLSTQPAHRGKSHAPRLNQATEGALGGGGDQGWPAQIKV